MTSEVPTFKDATGRTWRLDFTPAALGRISDAYDELQSLWAADLTVIAVIMADDRKTCRMVREILGPQVDIAEREFSARLTGEALDSARVALGKFFKVVFYLRAIIDPIPEIGELLDADLPGRK